MSKKPPYLLFIGLFFLLTLFMLWPTYTLLIKPRQQGFDWFWVWVGSQAIFWGDNPYSPETTRTIQIGIYGHELPPHQYQHGFPQPAYIAFVLWPFLVLPFFWSVWLWVAIQLPLYGVTLGLGLHVLNWQPSPRQLAGLLLLVTLGYRYPMIIYVLGQLGFWVLFCLVLAVSLFQSGYIRSAAVALAGATIRPDLALLAILLALFLIRSHSKRSQFILTLGGCGLILFLLPLPFIGFWPLIWLKAIFTYGSNPNATWPPGLLPYRGAQLIFILAMLIWWGRYTLMAWRNPTDIYQLRFVSATTLLMLLVLPQTGSYNLTFALVPAFILSRQTTRLSSLIWASLLMPWVYFMLGFDRLIFLLIPAQFILCQEWVMYEARRHHFKA